MKKCKNGPEKTQWLLKKEWRAQVRIYIQVFPTIGLAFYVPDFRGLVSFKPMKNLFLDNRVIVAGRGKEFIFKNEMMVIDFMEKGQWDPFLMY